MFWIVSVMTKPAGQREVYRYRYGHRCRDTYQFHGEQRAAPFVNVGAAHDDDAMTVT
jgi:hypothetical protein